VRLELSTAHGERDVAELLVVKEIAKILGQLALGHFELHDVGLSGDVHAVRHDADLAEDGQLVLRQQAVGLVQQEVAADELLEAPIFALHKTVSSAGKIYNNITNRNLIELFFKAHIPLGFHGFGFLTLGIQYGKFELGSDF